MAGMKETATFAGGCFWCMEAVFLPLRGVEKVVSGYTGGTVKDPTYRQVCGGSTGHAEAVEITFDPAVITYEELLEIFFALHDPTTKDRQGADVGTQYRSAVFYHSSAQKAAADAMIERLGREGVFPAPIVTEVVPAETFYCAEDYHQRYFEQNPNQPYCQAVVSPKVAKLRKKYAEKLAT
ncbi:MAG TPA: peptide-methionine (S)-S-oxide reductase MsrA [Thermoanaerobaculia bacterium]|nr:peptide-methionine (S)-S-oxide reductase MsrA [Thermoanaerobaculia bacterium]